MNELLVAAQRAGQYLTLLTPVIIVWGIAISLPVRGLGAW